MAGCIGPDGVGFVIPGGKERKAFAGGFGPPKVHIGVLLQDHVVCKTGGQYKPGITSIDQGQRYAQSARAIIIGVKAVVDTIRFAIAIAIDVIGNEQLVFRIDVFRVNNRAIKDWGMSEVLVGYRVEYLVSTKGAGEAVAGGHINTCSGIAGYAEFGADQHVFIFHLGYE